MGRHKKYLDLSKDINDKKINAVGHVGTGGQKGFIYSTNGLCPCLPATEGCSPTIKTTYSDGIPKIAEYE